MGIGRQSDKPGHLRLPLAPNINDKETAFAGSIFSLAVLTFSTNQDLIIIKRAISLMTIRAFPSHLILLYYGIKKRGHQKVSPQLKLR
ncbi:MAG TPA: hypothetical protein DCW97_04715 [Acidobacteria bacterium]|nr:hypothetical protein [Acidobacteriota bacterium]